MIKKLFLYTLITLPILGQIKKKSDYVNGIERNAGRKIIFLSDTEGRAYCSGPGCDCGIKFEYKPISADTIQLVFKKKTEYGDHSQCLDRFGSESNQCHIIVDANEPIYKDQLKCGHANYWSVASTKPNTNVNIAGEDVIYLGEIQGVVTDAVKTRIAPDTTSETAKCASDETPEPISALPKNTKLIVIARSQNKAKIQSWSNYWYYVKSHGEFGYSCSFASGKNLPYGGYWVYGQFIKLKK